MRQSHNMACGWSMWDPSLLGICLVAFLAATAARGAYAQTSGCESSPCGTNATCTTTKLGFKCTCSSTARWYNYVSSSCVDVDECAVNNPPCGGSSRCKNLSPGFSCTCPNGYQYSTTTKECVDINECLLTGASKVCTTGQSTCVNTDGSYYCDAYLGCYVDNPSMVPLPLPVYMAASDNMTIGLCAGLARKAGYAYYGLSSSRNCKVGNNYNDAARIAQQGASAGCTSACTGDKTRICGGNGSTSLYYTGGYNDIYLGCFTIASAVSSRKFMYFNVMANESMSPAKCSMMAHRQGLNAYAVQGNLCYVVYDLSYVVQSLVSSASCTSTCTSDPAYKCGGTSTFSLYSLRGLWPNLSRDLAFMHPTVSSPVRYNDAGFCSGADGFCTSDQAVDGNYSTIFHTDGLSFDFKPFIAVNLVDVAYIYKIIIFNRGVSGRAASVDPYECCGDRLKNAELRVGTTDIANATSIPLNKLVWKQLSSAYLNPDGVAVDNPDVFVITLDVPVLGSWVTLQNFNPSQVGDDAVINIRELEVYGGPNSYYLI